MEKVRMYGRAVRTWTATDSRGREVTTQREYEFTDYYTDGTLAGTGTETRIPEGSLECPGDCNHCGMCWALPEIGKDTYFHKP